VANEITIPILPCRSIDDTLAFYVALGFDVTYRQTRPNTYACVKYEAIDLHFFTMKGYEPKDSYSTCFIMAPDLAGLHQSFSAGLRGHYGKLPVAGIPRISRLNKANADKQLRFNLIDPGGNWIRFAQLGEEPAAPEAAPREPPSKLSRAAHAADLLAEAVGDYAAAARLLDKALAHDQPVPAAHRFQALVLRAALAVDLDDRPLARTLLAEARQIALEAQDREALAADLQRADDLARLIDA
jgi:catechol 2,3-dioxygenase-like lactoylglutathione lyase family enzyme